MNATSTEIILAEGRFFRRTITNQDLGHQEQILSSFAESNPVFLRNAASLGDQPVHMLTSKTSLLLITELKKLPFSCKWHYKAGALVPAWDISGPVVQIDDPWVPSEEKFGKLIFVQSFALDGDGFAAPKTTYLYCYREKELFWFPYPNLFTDGRVCMGRDWEAKLPNFIRAKTNPMGVLIEAQESFFTTRMNSDLTKETTEQCFRRTIDGEWIYHSAEAYKLWLGQCSSAHMRGFKL